MNEIYTEEKLLSEMYKNVKMGQENIASVIPKVDDKFMLRVLTARLEQFGAYSQKISDMMHEHGWEPKEPSTAAKLGEEGFIFGLPLRHGRGPPFKGDGGLWPVGGMQICLQFGPLALRCKGGYEGAGQSNKYLQAYAFTRQRPQG